MHHSHDEVTKLLDADEARERARRAKNLLPVPVIGRVTIDLEVGDSCWHPASTKHDLHGPIRVTFRRYPDGAVEAESSPLGQYRSNHWTPPAVDLPEPDGSVRHVVLDTSPRPVR